MSATEMIYKIIDEKCGGRKMKLEEWTSWVSARNDCSA